VTTGDHVRRSLAAVRGLLGQVTDAAAPVPAMGWHSDGRPDAAGFAALG
jgi:hypothetical protein